MTHGGLAGRIAARLDALEAGARAATEGEWVQEPDTMAGRVWVKSRRWTGRMDMEPIFQVRNEQEYAQREKDAAHIAAWDPAAVLRLVDRLRAVVALHTSHAHWGFCDLCSSYDERTETWENPHPCPTLLGIAAALGVEVGE